MVQKITYRRFLVIALLGLVFVVFSILSWLSQGTHGGGDDVQVVAVYQD